jgi:Cytidine and deoxycytidylate deaminase zinc-binding region
VDADGTTASSARGRRADNGALPGQLSGTRIAHAELNALAQLPFGRSYSDYSLYVSVEPCCLCIGAAIQTGIGKVEYAWADAYAGAARCMSVTNPQVQRKRIDIAGPASDRTGWVAGLLVAVHYALDRTGLDHVTEPWRDAEPDLFSFAEQDSVLAAFEQARGEGATLDAALARVGRSRA